MCGGGGAAAQTKQRNNYEKSTTFRVCSVSFGLFGLTLQQQSISRWGNEDEISASLVEEPGGNHSKL